MDGYPYEDRVAEGDQASGRRDAAGSGQIRPVERARFAAWIDAYERAWRTEGAELAELFAPDATYLNAPFQQPFRGLDAITAMWEAERGIPAEAFEMSAELVAVEGDTGVARVGVRYGEPRPQEYLDLWIITLDDDGRCTAFEEWPFWPPGSGGSYAGNTREPG
jgi:ketosteroid isomerase-like protein